MKNRAYPLYQLPFIYNLKDMASQKAQRKPDDSGFTFHKGGRLCHKTYKEVWEDIKGLGTWMNMEGFQETHVAILGENSYEWILAFLAIVSGGNVAVPIDKELPKKEVRRLMGQADVKAVFYSSDYADLVENAEGIRLIPMSGTDDFVKTGRQGLERGHRNFLDFEPGAESTACIFFTSGTTGISKGVMLSQGNLGAEIHNTCQLFKPEGSVIALLPFHHAFGLIIGLMMFHYGCNLYINKSLKNIKRALLETRPQTLFVVPLFIETFYKQIWDTARKEGKEPGLRILMKLSNHLLRLGIDVRKKWFSPVRAAFGGNLEYIISGGAALDVRYIKEFRSWGIEVLSGYGTTECSPCTAVNRNFHHKDGSVGLPIPKSRIKIGPDGEVLIAGPHVMQGYYKADEETKQVMKDGWYATGDLGFLDKDGFLTLTGRKKNLIILANGENVSPEELEEDFRKYPQVREVLVYEEEGLIAAEIYPEEEYIGDQEQFAEIMRKVNRGRPLYKQVAKVKLRGTEFEKNTSMKIIRYKEKRGL